MTRKTHRQPSTTTSTVDLNDPVLDRRVRRYIKWWSQFEPDPKTGCIESNLKASDPRGYTLRTCPILQKLDYVHRIAFRVFVGDIAEGTVIRHKVCNNPRCMRPDHLQSGDQKANMHDKMAAGRHRTSSKRRKRLAPQTVGTIKRDLANGMSGYAVARKYGLGQMAVSNIRTGKTYKAVAVSGFTAAKRKPGRPPKKPSGSARGMSLHRGIA